MIKLLRALVVFFMPSWLLRHFGGFLGVRLEVGASVGFSVVRCKYLYLGKGARIGHFNIVDTNEIRLDKESYISHLNRFKGPLNIKLSKKAGIGNLNVFVKAPLSVKNTYSYLYLGYLAKITSRHYIDCMSNITFLSFSTLAGVGSQMWTHGYYHCAGEHRRFRVDGSIIIGRYCYIGSGTVFNPGVKLCDSINLGANSTVSKSIDEPGFYVNQQLRKIVKVDGFELSMKKGDQSLSCEDFYVKEV